MEILALLIAAVAGAAAYRTVAALRTTRAPRKLRSSIESPVRGARPMLESAALNAKARSVDTARAAAYSAAALASRGTARLRRKR